MIDTEFDPQREVIDHSSTTRRRTIAVLDMLRPHDCRGVRKRRLGRLFDGGYVMVDDFDGVAAAYSIGVNDDVSWDLDVASMGIQLIQYDHTIDGLPTHHPNFKWRKIGLSHQGQDKASTRTLERLVSDNDHQNDDDLILKCDIEGNEWGVFATIDVALVRRFRQIVIELHALQELSNDAKAEVMRRAVTNLTANHHVVHVHANNWGPWAILGGIPVPAVLELTLLRKDRGTFAPSSSIFPTEIDLPCNPDRPDYPLGSFCFTGML